MKGDTTHKKKCTFDSRFLHAVGLYQLTYLILVPHICVGDRVSIGSDNGLSPRRHQTKIWTDTDILLVRLQGIYFNEFYLEIQIFLSKKMHFNMSTAKWRPFSLLFKCTAEWYPTVYIETDSEESKILNIMVLEILSITMSSSKIE